MSAQRYLISLFYAIRQNWLLTNKRLRPAASSSARRFDSLRSCLISDMSSFYLLFSSRASLSWSIRKRLSERNSSAVILSDESYSGFGYLQWHDGFVYLVVPFVALGFAAYSSLASLKNQRSLFPQGGKVKVLSFSQNALEHFWTLTLKNKKLRNYQHVKYILRPTLPPLSCGGQS